MALSESFKAIAKEVNNWGRWGPDDELGTLNLIEPDAVAAAAKLVQTGRTFSLAMPLSADGPQIGRVQGRVNPARTMTAINLLLTGDPADPAYSDDVVYTALQAGTHWDALSHVSLGGRLYNGFEAGTITDLGAAKCAIDKVKSIAGRGVLLDIARFRGVERIVDPLEVTAAEMDEAAEKQGVEIKPGDILLLRTGQIQLLADGDKVTYFETTPGPGNEATRWFREKDVAAVATDTMSFEVWPNPEGSVMTVHALNLVEMGLTQGQNFDLEELSKDCAVDGRYEFFISAAPEPFVGGVGSMTNPVVFK